MPIKATYTVKSGDRITYIANNYKVTPQNIIDVNPQIFTPDRIAKTNALIADGTIGPREVLIYPGEQLYIPTGFIDDLSENQAIKADAEDDLLIKIDNTKCPLPHEFKFTEYFDSCSDNFTIVYPNDAALQNPAFKINIADFAIKGLPDIKIYIGSDPCLTGQIEIPAYEINTQSTTQTLAGRSSTFLLEKSAFLPGIQKEFINMKLDEITKIVTGAYGLGYEIDSSVNIGEAFSKATATDNETPFDFISRLARERQAVVSNTPEGRCLIRKAVNSEPVANFKIDNNFLKFLGVESLTFTFDTQKIFGQYIGKTQTPDDVSLFETVKSSILVQSSVKITDYQEADDKTLRSITEWEEQKTVRDFYNNAIPYPSWLNPNTGKRWETGQLITIVSPESGIPEPVVMLIRQIDFEQGSGDSRTATLNIIPASVYL